jgi:hypothetical protein
MLLCFAVQTPELLADVEVPESVSILGQTVDLSQVRSLLQPVSQGLSGIISQVSGQPVLRQCAAGWLQENIQHIQLAACAQ